MAWRHQEAQQVGPRGPRPGRPAQPQRHRGRGDHHPERPAARHHQGATARGAARGHRPHRRDRGRARRAARPLPAGPLLPGLGRARRGRALVPQLGRACRGGRHRVGPLRRRRSLAPDLGAVDPRRLGGRAQAHRPVQQPGGQSRAAAGPRQLRDPAGCGPHRARRGPLRRAAGAAPDVAARRGAGRARCCPGDPARDPPRRRDRRPGLLRPCGLGAQ